MCGIAGFIDFRLVGKPEALAQRALAMSNAIRHRGPDGDGSFTEPEAGLGFSHRRLSIVDLSSAGAQPMTSANGRFVICYNGEIYNAEDMRCDPSLDGMRWRGHSDTEVILEFAAARGLDAMLKQANGMFALAMWDRRDRVLHLARDRMGIKPLFVAQFAQGLAFASELKALKACDAFEARIDERSVASFLRFAYVPAPHCIFRNVRKVRPAARMTIALADAWRGEVPRAARYWSLRDVARNGAEHPTILSDAEATVALDTLLKDAVSRQMISDVPLGALLSGGVDSSVVAAMMVAAGKGPVRTFSIGFEEGAFDESRHAEAVARHIGTVHTDMRVTARDALDVIPLLPSMYDEPFADSSQIPTYIVAKMTRQHVTVALSGDGGDELFAGYNRHKMAAILGRHLGKFPISLRRAASWVLGMAPVGLAERTAAMLPSRLRPAQAADKLRKLALVLPLDGSDVYMNLVSQGLDLDEIAPGAHEHAWEQCLEGEDLKSPDMLEQMQYRDMTGYLPDDILQKIDRASMAVALEVRPPLLDHRVVEFACQLPRTLKVRHAETKWILRRVLDRYVPSSLINRPKMGFAVPLAEWLRGPLKGWAEDLLSTSDALPPWLRRDIVWAQWAKHQDAQTNLAHTLWPILMLAAWQHAQTR